MSQDSIRAYYAQIRRDQNNPLCRECGRALWMFPDDLQSSPVGPVCWGCFIAAWERDGTLTKDPQMAYHRSTAGTYSQLTGAETCLKQFDAQYVSRTVPYRESPQQKEGTFQHKQLALRLNTGNMSIPLPADMQKYEPLCQSIERIGGQVMPEVKLAIDHDFRGTPYDSLTGFFRGDLDVLVLKSTSAFVGDWKTGDSHWEKEFQLEVYAVLVMAAYPYLTEVRVANIWLKEAKLGKVRIFTREKDFPRIASDLSRRWDMVERAKSVKAFPATPNNFCKGCWVDCEHNRNPEMAPAG